MLLTTSIFLKYTILFTSLVLIALSLASFYLTGHAMKTIATEFPGDEYVWYTLGTSNPRTWEHMVTLVYDWTTENLIFVTSGLSVVAGFLGVIGFVVNKGWRAEEILEELQSTRRFAVDFVFAFGAFGTGLVSYIFAAVYRANLKNASCRWEIGVDPNSVLTCTRELAACNLVPFIVDRSEAERAQACYETHAARMLMIPLAVFAFLLTVLYAVQRYRDQRAVRWVTADKRVGEMHESYVVRYAGTKE